MKLTMNGHDVRIATGGVQHDNDNPGVVLIHGAGMDRTTWQMQSRWLAHHGYRVAAVDLPGHGLSDGPHLASIEAMAEWIADLIDALEFGAAHLVGFSLGTFIGLEVAANHSDKVRSLTLIGTASAMPVHPVLLESSETDIPHASRLMTSWGLGTKGHLGGHPSPGMWLIGSSTALLDRSPEGALKADMEASNGYTGAVAAAANVSCPVTLVLGTEDKMTPIRAAGDLLAALPGAEIVTLEATGHMMPIEQPIEVRKAIAAALERATN